MSYKMTFRCGNSKRFKCENFDIVITWYYKKQMTLLFQGGEGSIFKDDLINAVEDREATKEEVICDNKRNHNETPTDNMLTPRLSVINVTVLVENTLPNWKV